MMGLELLPRLERGRGVTKSGATVLRTSQHLLDHFESETSL